MTDFTMLVGLPASGKSTLAKTFVENGYNVHSSDAIREELFGDVSEQNHNEEVFNELHSRIKKDLENGKDCVYDATNISYKRRKAFLDSIKKYECTKRCIFMATPYEECVLRNEERERRVPVEVIDKMYKHFDPPMKYEGWDKIFIYYSTNRHKDIYGNWCSFITSVKDYDQENEHHNMTLGAHCEACGKYIAENKKIDNGNENWVVYMAALLHDCGKPFCQVFTDYDGNPTKEAHYYRHENVGSYNSFFYDTWSSDEGKLKIAALIRWHMQPYFNNTKKSINKYKKLLGEELYDEVNFLHEADEYAH